MILLTNQIVYEQKLEIYEKYDKLKVEVIEKVPWLRQMSEYFFFQSLVFTIGTMHNERWLKNLFIKIDKKILEFIITWDESIVNYKYYTVGQLQVAINKIDEVIELLGPKLNKLKQACPPPVLKHWTYANDLYEFFTKEKSKLVDYRSSYISSRIKRFGGSLILRNNNDIVQPSYRILFESLDPRIIINPQDGSIIEIREGL